MRRWLWKNSLALVSMQEDHHFSWLRLAAKRMTHGVRRASDNTMYAISIRRCSVMIQERAGRLNDFSGRAFKDTNNHLIDFLDLTTVRIGQHRT